MVGNRYMSMVAAYHLFRAAAEGSGTGGEPG